MGSEMCIRDRARSEGRERRGKAEEEAGDGRSLRKTSVEEKFGGGKTEKCNKRQVYVEREGEFEVEVEKEHVLRQHFNQQADDVVEDNNGRERDLR